MNTHQLSIYRGPCAILRELNLHIPQKQWTSIVGPNGAGKSSLLQAMVGLLHYTGSISLGGTDLKTLSNKDRAKTLGWLEQNANTHQEFEDCLNVYDTVMLGRLPHQTWLHLPTPKDHLKVEQALKQTHSWELRGRLLHQLSGGERQRVLMARLLAVDAHVLLMDEPLANLDPPHQADWLKQQKNLLVQGKTLVTVLHEIHFALRADHIIMLNHGGMHFQGSSQDPQTHQALIDLFDGRIRLEKAGNDWVALPN